MQIIHLITAALLAATPAFAGLRQCAGMVSGRHYESSGTATASFTKDACNGSLSGAGNAKCCSTSNEAAFNSKCAGLASVKGATPLAQAC